MGALFTSDYHLNIIFSFPLQANDFHKTDDNLTGSNYEKSGKPQKRACVITLRNIC